MEMPESSAKFQEITFKDKIRYRKRTMHIIPLQKKMVPEAGLEPARFEGGRF